MQDELVTDKLLWDKLRTSGTEASIRDRGGGTHPLSCAISIGW